MATKSNNTEADDTFPLEIGDAHSVNEEENKSWRAIRANSPDFNDQFDYADNKIKTAKYTILTFIPKNLFEQFQRFANRYFVVLMILQLIPQISSLNAITTIIPLVSVLLLTAIKDAADDYQRHKSDRHVNKERYALVLRDGELIREQWYRVVVGDIIKMEKDNHIAADLILLSTSEPSGLCYIETAELDGETNLKVRQALEKTAEMGDDIHEFKKYDAEIISETPNTNLQKFDGTMKWNKSVFALDNNHVLLRGCTIRNTDWCFGLVVFAGRETKLMMNSGKPKFKRTNIDKLLDVLVIGIFLFLCSMCFLCTICCGAWETIVGDKFQAYLPWRDYVPGGPGKDGSHVAGYTVIALMTFLSYGIILNTVVPISLYVSVEIIRLAHSWWINWDSEMTYENENGQQVAAHARTTTLNEELGQIKYIFSDKTGTLTQNIMTFNKCSIEGTSYGDIRDKRGLPIEIDAKTPKVDFSWNRHYESSFAFYDKSLVSLVRSRDSKAEEFFKILALCHTVNVEEDETGFTYKAQSPDENALVSAARNFGYVFKFRTPSTITVELHGQEEVYELLCLLDFNSDRKRMSVILRKEDKIVLYCKGADSIIYKRLDPADTEFKETTTSHLQNFAEDGLRTLIIAKRDIDPEYWKDWNQRHHEASCSLTGRDEKVTALYEEIEQNLSLVGATAIEDKLQDGVPESIANLAKAGIKIWVLTGDKEETAINIGYSCRLLTYDMKNYIINAKEFEDVQIALDEALRDIKHILSEGRDQRDKVTFANGSQSVTSAYTTEGFTNFALVINGESLIHALDPRMEKLLLETTSHCDAVICCRVAPQQKADVVNLVKNHVNAITLAIGDGANDVSMIQAAHIGVGISGQEGMQAVLASDISMAQFRFLERLLLVHGRWSYVRMCNFLKYFFYKNFAFTLAHFWFAFFCGFSAQTLYDEAFIAMYNVVFTSLPVLALGIFDQDVNDKNCKRFPKLYTPGHLDLLFNKKVFAYSVIEGFLSSFAIFFITYGAFNEAVTSSGTELAGHKSFGLMVSSSLIVTVTLRCALDTMFWTGFNHFVIWGSIIVYFCLIFTIYSTHFEYIYMGTAVNLMATAPFWFTLVLTVAILLLPIIALRFYHFTIYPTLSDQIRLLQKVEQGQEETGVVLQRFVRTRSSRRSTRTGYAFAHQQGFGELITSGASLRDAARGVTKSDSNDNVKSEEDNRPSSNC